MPDEITDQIEALDWKPDHLGDGYNAITETRDRKRALVMTIDFIPRAKGWSERMYFDVFVYSDGKAESSHTTKTAHEVAEILGVK